MCYMMTTKQIWTKSVWQAVEERGQKEKLLLYQLIELSAVFGHDLGIELAPDQGLAQRGFNLGHFIFEAAQIADTAQYMLAFD